MTDSDWLSSFYAQEILRRLGCEVSPQQDPSAVNVYNPKTEGVVSMKGTGKIAPFEFTEIMARLGLMRRD